MMMAWDDLQRTRGLHDVIGEAVVVSMHSAVVGQVQIHAQIHAQVHAQVHAQFPMSRSVLMSSYFDLMKMRPPRALSSK
ncbi:hypothetical protein DUI87_12622 [Hirundo rustica rustica]|uniref:Uncharacterized protein n=1 Tax=Hirundo rustica rustica TaxID=333673 RepID=A0A3M0KCH2_HIRRU|nr:hypothetical protein DUI87_12622 [Hirundo rustica rustica]